MVTFIKTNSSVKSLHMPQYATEHKLSLQGVLSLQTCPSERADLWAKAGGAPWGNSSIAHSLETGSESWMTVETYDVLVTKVGKGEREGGTDQGQLSAWSFPFTIYSSQ